MAISIKYSSHSLPGAVIGAQKCRCVIEVGHRLAFPIIKILMTNIKFYISYFLWSALSELSQVYKSLFE
jgi:hypothetical protein